MKGKTVSNLQKKSDAWRRAGLITQKQQTAILSYEQTHAKSYGMLGLIWIGVFCIGLGTISLIAANWDAFSPDVKIGGAFFLFAAVLFGTFKSGEKGYAKAYEAGLFLTFLLCGALIGLVAQVFHLTADDKSGLLLWAISSLPIVLCSKYRLSALIWLPLFCYGILDGSLWKYIFRLFEGYPLTTTLFTVGVSGGVAYVAGRMRFSFFKAIATWAFIGMYVSIFVGEFALYDVYRHVLPGFALSILFLSIMSYVCLKTNHIKSFNANTVLIALRILVLYFQLFINLAMTGLGLMVSGGVILALAWGWQKIKNTVFKAFKGGNHA